MDDIALYTCLIGNYEELNELTIEAQVKNAFCFTDDPTLKSETWKIVLIEPAFPSDPVRSQRFIKILGHQILSKFQRTLYVDNSVLLLQSPKIILKDWLTFSDIAIPLHSFRNSVREEFFAVLEQKLDSRERVTEQLDHYSKLYPEALEATPTWNAIIARKNTPNILKFNRVWYDHVLRYSRRDQLSLNAAALESDTEISTPLLNNYESKYHRWPVRQPLNNESRLSGLPDFFELYEKSQTVISELEKEVLHERSNIEQIWNSFSWKVTKPLRGLKKIMKKRISLKRNNLL